MLLVLGYRSEDAAADMVAAVRGRRSVDQWVELAIQPLGTSEAEELATALLGDSTRCAPGRERIRWRAVLRPRARAHRDERHDAREPVAHRRARARIARLRTEPRRLLDVVAAAGGPITLRVARTAAGTGLDELILLRAARFLRSRGDGDDDLVECFHDRVRETAIANLAEPHAIHRAIAEALEREPVPDPEAIVEQFRAAGDDAQTLLYAERAADLAEHKLAFDRAADLYALALQLAAPGRRQYFAVCYAEALANAGRGAAAAAAFRTAADGATGDEQVRLRTRSAEQFLRSGLVDEGIEQLQPALAHLALRLPGSPRSALVTLLARRAPAEAARARVHRDPRRGAGREAPPHRLVLVRRQRARRRRHGARRDVPSPAPAARARCRRALSRLARDRVGVDRALDGGRPDERAPRAELGASAKAIAERIAHPHARAWAAATEAIAAECEGRWRDAQRHSHATIALFREAQTDVAWEVGSMYAWWLLPALYMAGDLVELADRAPRAAADADAVGDLYTATSLRTYLIPRMHLVAGNPERADAERAEAIGKWSRAGWHLQHWADLTARAEIALYRGDGAAAVRAWEAEWSQLRASLLLRMCMVGIQTRYSLGRALVQAGEPAQVTRAAKLARELGARNTAWAKCLGKTLEAGVAARRGERQRALALLRPPPPTTARSTCTCTRTPAITSTGARSAARPGASSWRPPSAGCARTMSPIPRRSRARSRRASRPRTKRAAESSRSADRASGSSAGWSRRTARTCAGRTGASAGEHLSRSTSNLVDRSAPRKQLHDRRVVHPDPALRYAAGTGRIAREIPALPVRTRSVGLARYEVRRFSGGVGGPAVCSGKRLHGEIKRRRTAPAVGGPADHEPGDPVGDDQNTLRAGARGPTLLEDFHFLEKMTHFDHERIPERIVHARGSAAHGTFAPTRPREVLARRVPPVGAETPVFVRFSTVAGGAGSVDMPRDVRGFATKFYTSEGVFDLVGNNIPVFFIQDAIKFPDFVHAVKMEPDRGFPQNASAHDTFWDFFR